MDKEQRRIILKWLKQGFIDWSELNDILNDKFIESLETQTEEEQQRTIEQEKLRLARCYCDDYCALMKLWGLCPRHQ